MTLNQARDARGSQHPAPKTRPRLRLKPKAPTTGYVDGAWWPRSDDLAIELPDLLAVLSVRLGDIEAGDLQPRRLGDGADRVRDGR